PSTNLLSSLQKKSGFVYPVELTPLLVAVGVAICSGVYFSTKKLRTDKTLRLGRTDPDLSILNEVLEKEEN
ncbi:Mra1p ASCRUDRAFT_17966, partial [Ascoidea rubescens DSM 1968]